DLVTGVQTCALPISDEVADHGCRDAAVHEVPNHRIGAAFREGPVSARRLEVAPVEIGRVSSDTIPPLRLHLAPGLLVRLAEAIELVASRRTQPAATPTSEQPPQAQR